MRHVLALAAVLALAPAPQPVVIAFAPAAGMTLQRTHRTGFALELESMSLSFDGEEVPAEYLGEMEGSLLNEETRVVTDHFAEVAEGRATRLVRHFDTLAGKDTRTFEGGEEPEEVLLTSALEGRSVVFAWSAEAEGYEREFAEGEDGDVELLEGLEEDMDLRTLLPDGEVEPGASWELEPQVYGGLIEPGGDLALLAEDEESAGNGELEENADGTVRATFVEVREQSGVRVAAVRLEFDLETYMDEPVTEEEEEDIPAMEGTWRTALAVEAAGELLWDLEHGHALALEIEGTLTMTMTQDLRGEMDGESLEQKMEMVFRGPLTIALQIERR